MRNWIQLLLVVLGFTACLGIAACGRPGSLPLQECGNGRIEGREDCDATALGGASCETLGVGTGTLACHDYCAYDTSGCVTP